MPWPRFAVAFSFSLLGLLSLHGAQKEVGIQMEDGSLLHIPQAFFHNIEFLKKSPEHTVLTGRYKDSPVLFLFVLRKSVPEGYQFQDELLPLLKVDKREALSLSKPLAEPEDRGPRRILNEGSFEDFLLSYRARYHPNGLATFFIMGPDQDYYRAIPEFQRIVDRYRPGPVQLTQPESIEPGLVVIALLTLVANMVLVWFGIKQIANLKRVH